MRRKNLWWGFALGTLLIALLTLGQESPPEGEGPLLVFPLLGPIRVTTDEKGEFLGFIPELPDVAVAGSLTKYEYDEAGDAIREVNAPGQAVDLYMEPKPGTDEIRGPWDIGSVTIFDPTGQFETRVVTWLKVSVGFRAGKILSLVSTGEVFLPRREPCTTCQDKIIITGEDRNLVQFHWFHCEEGVWAHKGMFRAEKVARLPEAPQPGQWAVMVSEDREGRTYTFYRAAEGQEPLTISRTVPVGDTLPPDVCQPCQYFEVVEGGTRLLYHCEPPGRWKLVRECQIPAESQRERETPPGEEEPPPAG